MLTTFLGMLRHCGSLDPHPPHETGRYDTVRHGRLSRFCPGMPGPGVSFRVVGYLPGDPYTPTVFRWVTPAESQERPAGRFLGERTGEAVEAEFARYYETERWYLSLLSRPEAPEERAFRERIERGELSEEVVS